MQHMALKRNQKLSNIPNKLTVFRIVLIPVLVLSFYFPFKGHYILSSAVFGLAAITDFLDGFLARKLQQESALGEFLDPVADKLIVAVALILLVERHTQAWLALPSAIIVGREILISALREWMAEVGKRAKIKVSSLGKIKTTVQMFAIIGLLSQQANSISLIFKCSYGLLCIAAILTLWSMVVYLHIASKEI